MARINFIVKSSKKGALATIYVRYREGRGIDLVTSSTKSIQPEYWSSKIQTIKQLILASEIVNEDDLKSMDDTLTRMKDFIVKERFLLAGLPDKKWLKDVVMKFNKIKGSETETLNEFIQRFIDKIKSGKRLTGKKEKTAYSPGTVKNYVSFQTQFNEFQESLKTELDFKDINIDIYYDYLSYFNKKNYSANTIGRNIKALKAIMRAAREEELHDNNDIERKAFSAPKADVENIYLTEEELNRMAELKLKGEKEVARDVCFVGCYTAQRYSDYSRIRPDNILSDDKGRSYIELIQKKTKVRVKIPIKSELDVILRKYNFKMPKSWEQKVNENIKKVGREAKITGIVLINESKEGRFRCMEHTDII